MYKTSMSYSRLAIVAAAVFLSGLTLQNQSAWGQEAQAPDEADSLFVCRFIKVAPENVAQWRQKVGEKNAKFGDGDEASRWGTWRIITGERTNQYARGFSTTSELYSNPKHAIQGMAASRDLPEAAYWLENVTPLQEWSGNRQVWKIIPGLKSQHLDGTKPAKFMQHRRWRMKPGMYQRLEANYAKLIEVYDRMDLPFDFVVARLSDGGDFMIYAETYAFDRLSDLPTMKQISGQFDQVHGEGSWEKFLKEHNQVMQENAVVEGETWAYEESLSNL